MKHKRETHINAPVLSGLYGQNGQALWSLRGGGPADGGTKRGNRGGAGYVIVLFAFAMYCLKYTFDYSEIITGPDIVNSLLKVIIMGCAVIKLMIQRYSPVRFALTISLGALIIYSCLLGGNYLYMIGFMIIIAMQDVDIVKLLKLSCSVKAVSIVIHVFWYIVIYFTDPSSIKFVYRGGADATGARRHYFFMGHANMFTAILVWTSLEFIYIVYKRLNAVHMAVIWIINLVFYKFTDSNTGLMVLALVTVLIVCDKFGKSAGDRLLTLLAKYVHAVCSLAFPVLAVIYPGLSGSAKGLWNTLDKFFSGRMWYGAYAYDMYGPTFLGRNLRIPLKAYWDGRWLDTFTVFDNYYLGQFLSLGIINLVIVSLAFFLIGGKMENKEKIIVAAFSFYGVMEAYVTNVFICFALLIIGKYLYLPAKGKEPAPAGPQQAKLIPLWNRSGDLIE